MGRIPHASSPIHLLRRIVARGVPPSVYSRVTSKKKDSRVQVSGICHGPHNQTHFPDLLLPYDLTQQGKVSKKNKPKRLEATKGPHTPKPNSHTHTHTALTRECDPLSATVGLSAAARLTAAAVTASPTKSTTDSPSHLWVVWSDLRGYCFYMHQQGFYFIQAHLSPFALRPSPPALTTRPLDFSVSAQV